MRLSCCILGLFSAGLLTGCLSHRKPPYASDPLLLHYKPTLNDSATILAEQQARRGPSKPPMPLSGDGVMEAKAMGSPRIDQIQQIKAEPPDPLPPPTYGPTSSTPLPPPGAPNSERMVIDAPPASAESSLPSRPAALASTPASPLPPPAEVKVHTPATVNSEPAPTVKVATDFGKPSVDGNFGHDNDYHWLQGVLECHYRGYYCLRFCDPSVEDQYGGKVRLEDDRRLAAFAEGDVIGVKGQIMPPDSRDGRGSHPRFVIRDIWQVRTK